MSFERPDGLVKRGGRGATSSAEVSRVNQSRYDEDEDERRSYQDDHHNDSMDEEEDFGDKHTRLNLMEQVLLLGIKDREVNIQKI